MQITTITTDYDPQEDRICLAIVDDQEQCVQLWLTQRLMRRLMPPLLQQTQAQIAELPATAHDVRQAANVYAQLQARLSQRPAQRVALAPATEQRLIHEINLNLPRSGGVRLEFSTPGSPPATLTLHPNELRQWLEAVRRAAQRGDWPSDFWPTWMGQPAPPA